MNCSSKSVLDILAEKASEEIEDYSRSQRLRKGSSGRLHEGKTSEPNFMRLVQRGLLGDT